MACGRGIDTTFLFIAPSLLGCLLQYNRYWCNQLRYSETAGKHLAQCWNATCTYLPCSTLSFQPLGDWAAESLWSISEQCQGPEWTLGTNPRTLPSLHHPFSLPVYLWHAACLLGRGWLHAVGLGMPAPWHRDEREMPIAPSGAVR